jgi:tetratricopeptide (TPR) repeat protein
MVRTILAAVLVNRAADRLEYDDKPDQALHLTQRALWLIGRKTAPLAQAHAGRAYHVRAESYLKLDRLDDAISAYSKAESCLRGRYIELYVRCCHDAAVTFANMGLEELARSYASRGKAVAPRVPGPYAHDFDRLVLELEECTAETYREYAIRMRDRAADAHDSEDARRALLRLAHATCEFGSRSEIEAVFEVIEALYRGTHSMEQRVVVLAPIAFLARSLQPVPDALLAASEEVISQLRPETDTQLRAEAHLTHAVALWSRDRREEAVDAALGSVALFNVEAWRTGASVVRLLTGGHRNTSQDVALRLACELGDGVLAAELIESARLPALPDPSAAHQTITVATPEGDIEVARRPLGPLHPIAVAGRSRIAGHYPSDVPVAAAIDLDAVTRIIGDIDAWWWGSWLGAYGVIFWAVRTPDGMYTCGVQDDAAVGAKLVAAHEAMTTAGSKVALRGVFNATAAGEEVFSAELGALLIPAELRSRLLRATSDTARDHQGQVPISLVIASNYLSEIPLILLGVGQAETGITRRVIEGAIVRLAPPAALLSRLPTPVTPSLPLPVSVLCRDPTDEFPYAQLSADCQHLLAGRQFCEGHPAAELATPHNVVTALRSVDSARSIFAYCGHAGKGSLGPDLESYIRLVDGVLTAESLLAGDTNGEPIPIPQRVLLAACNSSGSGGTGSGEWLGLAAAMFNAGAREIFATCWPIWDFPVTNEIDNELLQVLINAEDVAASLREIQLRFLDRWRSCDADYSVEFPDRGAPDPFPLVWAAYHYFGCSASGRSGSATSSG